MTGQGAEHEKLIPVLGNFGRNCRSGWRGRACSGVPSIPASRGVISHSSCLVSKPGSHHTPLPSSRAFS